MCSEFKFELSYFRVCLCHSNSRSNGLTLNVTSIF